MREALRHNRLAALMLADAHTMPILSVCVESEVK